MALSKSERLNRVWRTAQKQFDAAYTAVYEEREQCIADRRLTFKAGAAYEGWLGEQFANRPQLEANMLSTAVNRLYGDFEQNEISIRFISKDGKDRGELATHLAGMYRADRQDSKADAAEANAFLECSSGGIGAWRMRCDYEDPYDDDPRQRIRWEPLYDADNRLFFDPNSLMADKSDAAWMIWLTELTVEAYEDQYGKLDRSSWSNPLGMSGFDWGRSGETVTIAEYYRVEEEVERVRVFELIDGSEEIHEEDDFEEDEELEARILALGGREVKRKKKRERKIHKYILNGGGVIKDCGIIAGRWFPIIPQFGVRMVIQGVETAYGIARHSADMQRLLDMQISKLASLAATSATDKPIVTAEQIKGHELEWARAGVDDPPVLTINSITNPDGSKTPAGPVGFLPAATVPPAMVALMGIAPTFLKETLGNQDGTDRAVSGVSGEAYAAIQQKVDGSNAIILSNAIAAKQWAGVVWLSMAQEVYSEEKRRMKTVDDQGAIDAVVINGDEMMNKDGEMVVENDLENANFEVAVTVGPATASRKSATVKMLASALPMIQDPEIAGVATALLLKNMEIEGGEDLDAWLRKRLVSRGVFKPTDAEMEEMQASAQNQPPDAQTVYLMAEAENSRTKALVNQTSAVKNVAEAEKTRAQIAEILAGIETDKRAQIISAIESAMKATGRPQTSATMTPTAPAMGEGVQ